MVVKKDVINALLGIQIDVLIVMQVIIKKISMENHNQKLSDVLMKLHAKV
jgi:hypothetical protein